MIEEYERKKRKQISAMRSMMDYVMGAIFLIFGMFFFFRGKFNIPLNKSFPPNEIDNLLGGILLLYGAWRIYRGYQKKYFR
jgi:small neutral amino acid transporter SnatA (MarC family)